MSSSQAVRVNNNVTYLHVKTMILLLNDIVDIDEEEASLIYIRSLSGRNLICKRNGKF
jgi:hypothetical protein